MRVALVLALIGLPSVALGQLPRKPRTLIAKSLKKPSQRRPLTPEMALDATTASAPRLSPDGLWVLFEVRTRSLEDNRAQTQLHMTSIDGSIRRPLTTTGKYNGAASWAPDGKRIVFVSSRSDTPQLYLLSLNGGEAEQLTKLPGGASDPVWSSNGKFVAFTSAVYPDCSDNACNDKRFAADKDRPVAARAYDELLYRHWNGWSDGTVSHVFVLEVGSTRQPRDVTPGPHAVPPPHLNAGRGFAFLGSDNLVYCMNESTNTALSTNHDLYVTPIAAPRPRKITDNPAWDSDPVPSPDGRYIAYLTSQRAGFESDRAELAIYDVRSGKTTQRAASFDRPIGEIAWMGDSAGLYLAAYHRGYRVIASVGREAGEVAIQVDNVSARSLNVSDRHVVYAASSFDAPSEIFAYDRQSSKTAQITDLNAAWKAELQLGATEPLVAKSNGAEVHGFLTYPPGFSKSKKYPLLLLIHGGPQGAWMSGWGSRWNPQIFAAKGYVVAMPNPRGSIGYGQAFTDAVTKNWGGDPYDDVMAFTDAVEELRFIDGKRTCAAGASYGGYMVNWIAGHTDRFKCLISHAGLFDMESFWGDTEELWFPEWEMGGPPWKSDLYDKWSPHKFAASMKTPTLVIHGQLDYRVDLSHGLGMFTALRRQGIKARLVYFPDEGHWIKKPKNFVYWYDQMHGWLNQHLAP